LWRRQNGVNKRFRAKFCCPGVGLSTDFHRIIGYRTMGPVFRSKTG